MINKELHILLVDDDEDEYILLRDMIRRLPGQGAGMRVSLDWSSSYQDGLRACCKGSFDILLVDYHLGQYNGLELIRAVQEQGCSVPSIMLTGQGSYELDLAASEQGVYDFLLKDQVNELLLERTIRYALERRQTEEELEDRVRARTSELAEANQVLKDEISRRTQVEAELREREARLSESESRFRALTETTSAAIFIVQDGVIRYANPAARFVTGFPPDELVGRELWRLAHPAYQAHLRESRMATQWAPGVAARYEIKIIHKTGAERWVDLTAGEILYDGRPARVFTAFDITERDLAEKALRQARDELEERVAARTAELAARTTEIEQANQRLETMVRTLPVGVAIADPRGRIITGNDALRGLWDSDKPLPENINDWPPLVGRLTETGEPLHLRDWLISRSVLRGEAVLGVTIDILSLSGKTKTILYSAVPIIEPGGGVAGGVAVTQEITQQRLLEMQAQTAAREAQQRADELEGLHRATAALLSTLDLDELLCQILDAAQSAIPAAERGMLHLVSPADGQLHARATLGFNDERICVIPPDGEPGYPAGLVNAARPLIVADTRSKGSELPANMLPERMRDARSVILAPLTVGERMLGTLSLSAAAPDAFSDSNLRLLASFAATTTAALQNALLHAEIKQLAVTDPLTGRYNRRAFFELGQRELERFMRFRHPLTAMMIDLDHFKHINDRYGHVSGDQILRVLAERIATTIRDTDIFARYGGDEFVLLLPDSEISVALRIASRIREAVNHASWDTDGSQEPISVSMGLAQASPQHHMLEELLAEADQALYQAKTGGRDRVEVFQRQA